eukprot:SAG11_NODE_1097_length_5882_cov_3.116376_5_plen_462_part_00
MVLPLATQALVMFSAQLSSSSSGATSPNFPRASVTISNSKLRMDSSNRPVNAHSGNIVKMGSTYFMYGENYGDAPGYAVPGTVNLPRLAVYSSPDMVKWTFGGLLHNNTPGKHWADSGLWPGAATDTGTWWCPWAVYAKARRRIILWWTATPGACCDAAWGVAESTDGVHFDLITLNETGASTLRPPNGWVPPPPPAPPAKPVAHGAIGTVPGAGQPKRCLTGRVDLPCVAHGRDLGRGCQVSLESCDGGANQTWELLENNKLFLVASGACLDAALGAAAQTVYTNYCTPSTHGQTWNLTHTGELELPSTGRCVAVPVSRNAPTERIGANALVLDRCGVERSTLGVWAPMTPELPTLKTLRAALLTTLANEGAADQQLPSLSSSPRWLTQQHTGVRTSNAKDGNAIMIDDDGVGYIAYTAINPGSGLPGHMVAIERLTPDLLHSTKEQVGVLFPDSGVEVS